MDTIGPQLALDAATDIAVEAGVLARCEFHGWVRDTDEDPSAAYRLGTAKFKRGELPNHFRSLRELTDTIKEALESAPEHGCPECKKWSED